MLKLKDLTKKIDLEQRKYVLTVVHLIIKIWTVLCLCLKERMVLKACHLLNVLTVTKWAICQYTVKIQLMKMGLFTALASWKWKKKKLNTFQLSKLDASTVVIHLTQLVNAPKSIETRNLSNKGMALMLGLKKNTRRGNQLKKINQIVVKLRASWLSKSRMFRSTLKWFCPIRT